MKFYVNAGKLTEDLQPIHIAATKIADNQWFWAETITIKSNKDEIKVSTYQQEHFVETVISENNCYGLGYLCMDEGALTVNSHELMDALKSFAPSDSIMISDLENVLKLVNVSDEDEFQTILIFDDHFEEPEIATEFIDEFVIDRQLFIKGINKVSFAMGTFETQSYYMCLFFNISGNSIRFAAGSGARFAIFDIVGTKLTKNSATIHFPSNAIPLLNSILSKTKADRITVKQTKLATGSLNQVLIEFDGTQIVISNLDSSINYPSMDMIIKHTYPYEVSVNKLDLQTAVSGILATYTKKLRSEYGVHSATLTADFTRGFLTLTTDAETSSSRKAYFADSYIQSEIITAQDLLPYFKCNSCYLTEIIKNAKKCKNVCIAFEDTGQVEIDERTGPVLVTFPSVVNESEKMTEKLYLFFAVSAREEI